MRDTLMFPYDADDDNSGGITQIPFRIPGGKLVAPGGVSDVGKSTVGRLLV